MLTGARGPVADEQQQQRLLLLCRELHLGADRRPSLLGCRVEDDPVALPLVCQSTREAIGEVGYELKSFILGSAELRRNDKCSTHDHHH